MKTVLLIVTGFIAGTAPVLATATGCDPVLEAEIKSAGTPSHSTEKSFTPLVARFGMKAQQTSEGISDGKDLYVKDEGESNWTRTPGLQGGMRRGIAQTYAQEFNCQYERDETISGDVTSVYVKSMAGSLPATTRLWISKSSGLIRKETIDVGKPNAPDGSHSVTTIDYDNVQMPQNYTDQKKGPAKHH